MLKYNLHKRLFFTLLVVICTRLLAAQPDSIRLSLLTCAPGDEIYQLFGHTALRYENLATGEDLVFNYGMFSFRTPNFVYRFVKGETDYQLGIMHYRDFCIDYELRGSKVWQQTLHLTAAEKMKLLHLLEVNYRPANRTYRYNYFYDNCTTRARDRIEECINGFVRYAVDTDTVTYRSVIHSFTRGSEWDELGIDLLLGMEADKPITNRQRMFSPLYMQRAARRAIIDNGHGVTRPLVVDEREILSPAPSESGTAFPLSPFTVFICLLVFSLLMAVVQIKSKHVHFLWDVLLFGAQGVAGCIIAFMLFFSVHPTVNENWLILLLNPLPLVYLPRMIYKGIKNLKDNYHLFNALWMLLFVCLYRYIPQYIPVCMVFLAWCLLVNSLAHIFYYKRNFK